MRHISLRRERDRVLIAAVAALIVHALIAILIPFSVPAERDALDPPLYVALDPLPPEDVEETPEAPAERPDEQEPEPPAEPEPEPPSEAETDSLRAAEEPEAEAPAESEPAPEPEPDPAPEPAPEPQPEPAPEPDPEPEPPPEPAPAPDPEPAPEPAPEPEPDPAPQPSGPAFVESPPPPPPPPRQRERSNIVTDFGNREQEADSTGVEEEISELYEWQSQYREQLAAWEERQEERSSRVASDESQDDSRAAEDTALARRLTELIEGIRSSSSNVVNSDDPTSQEEAPSDEPTGDGSGITVEGESGSRVRLRGASVDLSSVSLGSGFPPDYPVQVRFTVNAAGAVIDARVEPPTPEPDLNRAIEAAVEEWLFQPAPAGQSGTVEGSVTIIVQTR
ncbi:MAG: energy transducer TonB [Alkalispirochaeta sp.]